MLLVQTSQLRSVGAFVISAGEGILSSPPKWPLIDIEYLESVQTATDRLAPRENGFAAVIHDASL